MVARSERLMSEELRTHDGGWRWWCWWLTGYEHIEAGGSWLSTSSVDMHTRRLRDGMGWDASWDAMDHGTCRLQKS